MKTTTVTITDDLDGSGKAESVTFAYQGRDYEIDLSPKNCRALEKALKPYIEAARATSGRRAKGLMTTGRTPRHLAAIREWAQAQGETVSPKGRIPKAVIEAYDAAH